MHDIQTGGFLLGDDPIGNDAILSSASASQCHVCYVCTADCSQCSVPADAFLTGLLLTVGKRIIPVDPAVTAYVYLYKATVMNDVGTCSTPCGGVLEIVLLGRLDTGQLMLLCCHMFWYAVC